MSNQTGSAIGAISTSINWERKGIDLQAIIEAANQGKLGKPLTDWFVAKGWEIVEEKTDEAKETMTTSVIKCISEGKKITIKETDRKRTLAKAKKTFPYYLYSDFVNYWTDVQGSPKGDTDVSVHEMIGNGDFRKIFGSFGVKLDALCLEQDQIVDFCVDHRDKLNTGGYATLFLFKVGIEFFVAVVYFDIGGKLKVRVDCFSYDGIWGVECRHRIVVPQLALVPALNN